MVFQTPWGGPFYWRETFFWSCPWVWYNIRTEYSKWQKTNLSSLADIYVSPAFKQQILATRKTFPWQKVLLISSVAIGLISIGFNIHHLKTDKVTPSKQEEYNPPTKSETPIVLDSIKEVESEIEIVEVTPIKAPITNDLLQALSTNEVDNTHIEVLDSIPQLQSIIVDSTEEAKEIDPVKPFILPARESITIDSTSKKKKRKKRKSIIPISDNL